MSSGCFKRYRMEIDLEFSPLVIPATPPGYRFVPWHDDLLDAHARVKFESFCGEIDAEVFPCLGDAAGCLRLMNEIAERQSFLPGATWLAVYHPHADRDPEYCGTIQGICSRCGYGSIQNIGVTPPHRHSGLGTGLIARALHGFRAAGLSSASLEVTAKNDRAVQLYERLGFSVSRTVYKSVDAALV